MTTLALVQAVPILSLDMIAEWLRCRAGGAYGGEAVTPLEHALQCATLAQEDDATPAMVTAALLHDIGHMVQGVSDTRDPHEELGSRMLVRLFKRNVTEPVRLHVGAKRYLCEFDKRYGARLSAMSKSSLVWQGGAFTTAEAVEFIAQPYAIEAIRLRCWDDAAKVPGIKTPPLETFLAIMHEAARKAMRPVANSA
jgi:predicted HD phosphohydrolase